MYLRAYGDESRPKMLHLHPMSITGEDLYRAMTPYWREDYFTIVPDEGGHGKSGPYVSLADETQTLKRYLLEHGFTEFAFLYAASMGTTVGYELLKDPTFTFLKIWFDGAGFSEKAFHLSGAPAAMIRLVADLYHRHPGHIAASFQKHYGEEFGAVMEGNFLKLGSADIVRVVDAFGQQTLTVLPQEVQRRMHLEWGEKDPNYRTSKAPLSRNYPAAQTVHREGYGHCGYMAFHTEEYVREIEAFLNGEAENRKVPAGQA